MDLILRVVIFVAIIRLLVITEKPIFCAGVYTGAWALLGLFFGASFLALIISTAIMFAYCWGYFWLLVRYLGTGLLWYLVLIGGLILPPFVNFLLRA